MKWTGALPEPMLLRSGREERQAICRHIRHYAEGRGALKILDAGCGQWRWPCLLAIPGTLNGIDIDEEALAFRQAGRVGLDRAILGDLRTVILEEESYDAIVCRHVLEHVAGAERVLEAFVSWLRPGGIIALAIPNRDSVHGFLTRITPFRFHAVCRRHVLGLEHAGQPGHGPSPKVFDRVVSRKGVWRFCQRHGLTIRAEYASGTKLNKQGSRAVRILVSALKWAVHLASLRTLNMLHAGLLYIIEKAQESRTPAPHRDAPPRR
jgi:SAM-dependent methyltransferase